MITRVGEPIARLVPASNRTKPRTPGAWRGQGWIADDFDDTPEVAASAVTAWEMAIKATLGELAVPDRLAQQREQESFDELPVTSRTAWQPALCRVTTATRSTAR